jgi:hypothetical protein
MDFILDLALMCDVLEELAELSTELQTRDITLYSVHNKINNQLKLFDERKTNMGHNYLEALKAEKGLDLNGVSLENGARYRQGNRIDPVKFYDSLKARMESRLLARDDSEIPQWANVLDCKTWPDNPPLTFGEIEIINLCERYGLPDRQILTGFREYLSEKKIPSSLMPLLNAINNIPISTNECERGFSQMNLIVTPIRASLQLSTVVNLMFIKLVGPPVSMFKPSIHSFLKDIWRRTPKVRRGFWKMLVNTASCKSGSYCELCNMR